MNEFIFNLGDEVKDIVTGFKGAIMARVQYFTGCNQYHVQPSKVNEKGEMTEGHYFDETRLVKTGKKCITLIKPMVAKKRGGPAHELTPTMK